MKRTFSIVVPIYHNEENIPDTVPRLLALQDQLNDWNLAEQIPSYLERVRGWGYSRVRVRQLSHNRQEVCLAALRPTQKTRRRTRLHRPPTDRRSTD